MRAALSFLGSELGIYAIIAVAALTLTSTTWNWQSLVTVPRLERALESERAGRATDRAAYESRVRAALAAETAATQRERAAETFWRGKVDEAVEDGNRRVAAERAGRDAVARQLDGLRRTTADLAAEARRSPTGAVAPPECAPAIAAVDLQADMLDRISRAAGELAAFADATHTAGLVCERAWPLNPAASAPQPMEVQP